MSKITVAGDAIVVTSALKLEELKLVEKYRPEALVLMGGEDGKEPVFAVNTCKGAGAINQYGASFGRETEDGYACITMVAEKHGGDIKEFVVDAIGGAVCKLNQMEDLLPAVLDEIQDQHDAIIDSISIA